MISFFTTVATTAATSKAVELFYGGFLLGLSSLVKIKEGNK